MASQPDTVNHESVESYGCSDEDWAKKYNEIKSLHDEAFGFIESGIELEELDKQQEALDAYKYGMTLIDKVLNIYVECPEHTDSTWEAACRMIQKMKRTRAETLKRVCALHNALEPQTSPLPGPSQTQPDRPPGSPPSYDEAMSESSGSQPQTYSELASALENLQVDTCKDGKEAALLYTQPNVRIYFIAADGTVAALPDLLTLNVFSVLGDKDKNEPSAFIQISEWIYPLIPGVSPCFKSESGALIFPDINAAEPGSAIGIVLPPEAEMEILLSLLDDIIHGVVTAEPLQYTPVPRSAISGKSRSRRALSSTISTGLVNGAWYMKEGLVKGAQAAGSLINYGTPKLINHLTPAQEPTQVNPKFQQGLNTAKNVTGTALSVTGYVAGKVGDATVALGHYLAPHIQKQGTKLLSSGFAMDEQKAHERMDGVLTVAAGAVEGFATVYSGLEQSASILGKNITENTVKVVEHKYGPEAGAAASDSIYTANNMFNISSSLRLFKPTSIAKLTVKNTGKGFLQDFKQNHHHYHIGPAGDTPTLNLPDLSQFEKHISK